MSAQHASPAPEPVTGLRGTPSKPVPFDMNEWRKRWGAWWSQANREVINAAIRGAR